MRAFCFHEPGGIEKVKVETLPDPKPGLVEALLRVKAAALNHLDIWVRKGRPGLTLKGPHVLGSDGVHWMLDASEGLPLTVFVMAPSCVPASAFESPRRALTPGDMEAILRRRRALGVAEMMNFPGVVAGDPEVLERLEVRGAAHADGHAPGLSGRALDAYAAA